VLQDGTFERVGGQAQIHVDVRLVAATNCDLRAMVEAGTFRQDLWYRIAVFPIVLPPLRERPQDIAAMADHFARRAAARLGLAPQALADEDRARLCAYSWPGNVRELAAVMERAAILGEGRSLAVAAALGVAAPRLGLAAGAVPVAPATEPFATLDTAMARHIELALMRSAGRIEGPWGAARLLGINPHTLRARMRRLGVDWARFRG
jgi:transcriptional regulator with GAF, ATPase, and Fis domain